MRDGVGDGVQIPVLVRRIQGGFVNPQIGNHRVEQEHQVNDVGIRGGVVLQKKRQEWIERQPHRRGKSRQGPIGVLEKAHQGLYFFPVVFRKGLIQGITDGNTDSGLRQRKNGQNVRHQAVDAQIFHTYIVDQHSAGDKAQQNDDEL